MTGRVRVCIDEALDLSRRRRWGAAALAWAHAAHLAFESDDELAACRCWEAAGESWRRDDQPLPAARALRRALVMGDAQRAEVGAIEVKLAATLGDLGDVRGAGAACDRALARELDARPLALDARLALALGRGDVRSARQDLEALEVLPGGRVAATFRRAQLLVLDGHLEEAVSAFDRVLQQLRSAPEAEAGVAAAHAGIAEVALLRGDLAESLEMFDLAVRSHQRAGRRALAWLAEAGRVRAAVEAGARPLHQRLDAGLGLAADRRLVGLEASLRLARGIALAVAEPGLARGELQAANELAARAGHVLVAGRACYVLATRVGTGVDRRALLKSAATLVQASRPWTTRVELALAELDGQDRLRNTALTCMARFESMGMANDAARARALVTGGTSG